jgi:hypothetical protein
MQARYRALSALVGCTPSMVFGFGFGPEHDLPHVIAAFIVAMSVLAVEYCGVVPDV